MEPLVQIINNLAGIDIGDETIFVAAEEDEKVIRTFLTFTNDFISCIDYLKCLGIKSVVMEATGIYWISFCEMLESHNIRVNVINGGHARNLPGRKSDAEDCQWIRTLYSYGLLRNCFIPDEKIRIMRSYVRLREDHLKMGAQHIQHMQKALIQMNIRLTNAISHINGVSGIKIIKAIIGGERDPEKLVLLCDKSILLNKKEIVIESLIGNYRTEHLFALKQALQGWEFYQQQANECAQKIDEILCTIEKKTLQNITVPKKISRKTNVYPIQDFRKKVICLTGGKDVISMVGMSESTVLEIISEIGTDLSKWQTSKHFTSWLGLAPHTNQSGKTKKKIKIKYTNRAGQKFRLAAMGISASKNSALQGFYHRIKSKKGGQVANKATARKLATMFYNIMTKSVEYVEMGIEKYNEQYHQRQIKYLEKKATELGFSITPV